MTDAMKRQWWETGYFRALEGFGIVAAIFTAIGSLGVSAVGYRHQQDVERAALAAKLVLFPDGKTTWVQNFGELPVMNISVSVSNSQERAKAFIGPLAPCSQIDLSEYTSLNSDRDMDRDGVLENGDLVKVEYTDVTGKNWWREGYFGNDKSIAGSLSGPREGSLEGYVWSQRVSEPPAVRAIDGCG